MEVVAVDIMGPFPESKNGNSYILVAGDYFTRWMEAYAIPNQEATTVAQKLVDELFCRFSPPKQLHSDQGRQFEGQVMQEICKLLHIRKTKTTPYHPQGDGLVERFNRTLQDMLATTVRDHPFDWEEALRKVCFAYNSSVQASTGYTPFYLMFGREARLPVDIMYGPAEEETADIPEHVTKTKKTLELAYSRVHERLNVSHQRQKEHYDKKVHGSSFADGDLVWLHNTVVPRGKSKKLHHPWTGPYRIVSKLSDSDYKIKLPRSRKPPMVVHFNRLKFCSPNIRFTEPFTAKTDTRLLDQQPIGTNHVDAPIGRYPSRTRQAPDRFVTMIAH